MNRFSIAVAAIATAAFSQVALAADMPSKGPAIAPAPIPPSWTGFYLGGNLGGAWMNGQDFAFADPGKAVQQRTGRTKNFAYGMVYVGYSF